jgi:hypothetical protein
MDPLALKLNPLSRLKIYEAVRKIVLAKMNSNEIPPDTAKEIIGYAKGAVAKVKTAGMAESLMQEMAAKYPELNGLASVFEREACEQYDRVASKIVDRIIEKNEVELADGILKSINKSKTEKDKRALLADLEKKYPREYDAAVASIIKSQNNN